MFYFFYQFHRPCCRWALQYNPDPDPNANQLRAVWGPSGTEVFAVGEYGTILHTTDNGTVWNLMPAGIIQTMYGIWGSSATDIFVAADTGIILHYNGSNWSSMTSPINTRLRDVWGSSGTDVFAVGENGKILHYDGDGDNDSSADDIWELMTSPTPLTLQGVWGSAADNVFAVGGPSASSGGDRGIILKYNGSSWSIIWSDPSIMRFHDIWGSSGTNLFAVGEAGAIVHTTDGGTNWVVMDNPVKGSTVTLRDIWGSSESDIFAVGDGDANTDYGSTILHYDGSAWNIMNNPRDNTSTKLHGVWGSASDNVFAVGDRYVEQDGITTHGTILHYTEPQTTSSTTTQLTSTTTTSVPPATTTTTSITPVTTTTTTASFCVCTKIFNSENSSEVKLIRDYRNRRLAKSLTGLRLIYLYYAHSPELTNMLSLHPQLFARAAALSKELIPRLQKGLQNNTSVTLAAEQFHALRSLLSDVRNEASPRLKNTVDFVLRKLNSENFLKTIGVTVIH